MLLGLVMMMGAEGGCDLAAILGLTQPAAKVPATVAVTGAASATASPIVFTATFDKDVTGLAAAGVTLGGTAKPATVAVSGSGKVWTLSVSGMTAAGTVTVVVNKDAVADPGNAASTLVSSNFNPAAPTVAVSAAVVSGATATYTVTYTGADAVTLAAADVTVNKTGTVVGTAAVSGTGNATRTVTISGLAGEGTASIAIAAGTASNFGVKAAAATGAAFAVDTVAPTAVLSAPSVILTNVGPVTYTVTYTGASTVTLKAADVTLNKTGTATGTVAVSGSTVTISAITGDGTLGISLAAGTAADSAGNLAAAVGPSATFAVDNTAPAISIGVPSVTATVSGPVTYTVYYNVPTVTLAPTDVTLVKTLTANGVVAVTGSGMVRFVTISNITGTGTLGISIAAGTGKDDLGNATAAATSDTLVNVDNTAPTVTVTPAAGQADPALGGPVHFTAKFSEPVSKPDAAKVLFAGSGAFDVGTKQKVDITAATSPSDTWDIAITGMDVDGGAIVVALDNGAAADAAGNLSSLSTNTDNFVQTYDLTPVVKITAINGGNPVTLIGATPAGTQADPVVFRISIEDGAGNTKDLVGNLDPKYITVGGTAGATKIVTPLAAPANQHTWLVSAYTDDPGLSKDGTITVSLAAGALKDAAGQGNAAGTGSVTRDSVAPTVTIALASGQNAYVNKRDPVKFTVTFSKDVKTTADALNVNGFVGTDFTPAGNSNPVVLTGGPRVFNAEFTVNTDGDKTLALAKDKAFDFAGNGNTASATPDAKVIVYEDKPAVIGAVLVPNTTTTVEVSFDHDMDKTTVETAAAYTFPGSTVTVKTVAQQADKKVVRLTTSDDATNLLLQVDTATIKDMAGNLLGNVFQQNLPYYAIAPKVVKWVKVSKKVVRVTFDHVLDPDTVKGNPVTANGEVTRFSYVAVGAAATDVDKVELDATGKVVTITQTADMVDGGFIIAESAGGVEDLFGRTLVANDSLLGIVSFTKATNTTVEVAFSRPMATASMVAASFSAKTAANVSDPVTGVAVKAGTNNQTWVVTLNADVTGGTLTVKANAAKSADGLQTLAETVTSAAL